MDWKESTSFLIFNKSSKKGQLLCDVSTRNAAPNASRTAPPCEGRATGPPFERRTYLRGMQRAGSAWQSVAATGRCVGRADLVSL